MKAVDILRGASDGMLAFFFVVVKSQFLGLCCSGCELLASRAKVNEGNPIKEKPPGVPTPEEP